MTDQLLLGIGKKIRSSRKSKGLTIDSVAKKAKVSKGLVSKIENGRTIPSLPVLISIINALKVDINTFFNGIELITKPGYTHIKEEDYLLVEKEEAQGYVYNFIHSQNFSNFAFEAEVLDLEPEAKRKLVATDGYEFLYILKGEINYRLDDKIILLKQGDSLFFNGKIPHVPYNKTDKVAKLLVIYLLTTQND
jgi:transcriptional regulator with XRE-family HTH domain